MNTGRFNLSHPFSRRLRTTQSPFHCRKHASPKADPNSQQLNHRKRQEIDAVKFLVPVTERVKALSHRVFPQTTKAETSCAVSQYLAFQPLCFQSVSQSVRGLPSTCFHHPFNHALHILSSKPAFLSHRRVGGNY